MTGKQRAVSTARHLHRSLGAIASMFVIFLVLSGVAINHSQSLGLDRHPVTQSLLLRWYGLNGPAQIQSFKLGGNWLSFADSQVYLNTDPIAEIAGGVGAVATSEILVAAGREELLLLTPDGQVIERQDWAVISQHDIVAIGKMADGTIALRSDNQTWQSGVGLVTWNLLEEPGMQPTWVLSSQAPPNLLQAISSHYRGDELKFERVLLDLHSGRFFGPVGVLVYDLLALILGFLAVSGLILWFRSRRNGKKKSHRLSR